MSNTLPPLPPLPSWLDEFPHEHREWIVPRLQAYALAAIEPQGVPEISTEHGPWIPSTLHENETYCKRCLLRSAFATSRKCEPHIIMKDPPAPKADVAQQDAKPVAAQHRFRHPQIASPDWSPWQPCKVSNRPAWKIDSQGYEVEYRELYTRPAPKQDAELERKLKDAYDEGWNDCEKNPRWSMKDKP